MAAAPKRPRYLSFVVLAGIALVLFATRPRLSLDGTGGYDKDTATCLSNLSQISRAYAQYARDYDGKIPRGVDPGDKFNAEIWKNSQEFGGAFYDDALHAPLLSDLLRPYVQSPEVFHCPADVGWTKSRLAQADANMMMSGFDQQKVSPSSFAKYGSSYYCWTKYGFALNEAADIPNPARTVLLFDGDLWHSNAGRDLIDGLFADGHVQNLTLAEFLAFSHD